MLQYGLLKTRCQRLHGLTFARPESSSSGTFMCPRQSSLVFSKGQLSFIQEEEGQAGSSAPPRPQSLIETLLCGEQSAGAGLRPQEVNNGCEAVQNIHQVPPNPAVYHLFLQPLTGAPQCQGGGHGRGRKKSEECKVSDEGEPTGLHQVCRKHTNEDTCPNFRWQQ